jgi:hypothetical protein
MGKKAINQPSQNIVNISNKNKWRVGDCSVCGKTNIRSSKWKSHENHGEIDERRQRNKSHKQFAKSVGKAFKSTIKKLLYARLSKLNYSVLPAEEQLDIYGRIQFGILSAIGEDPAFMELYHQMYEQMDDVSAITTLLPP